MSGAGVIETLVGIVGNALSPLAERLQGDQAEQLLDQLGMRLPPGLLGSGAIPQRIQQAADACLQLPPAVQALIDAIEADDNRAMLNAALQLGLRIGEAGNAFVQLGTSIDTAIQAAASLTVDQKARLGEAARQLPERLLHLTLISWVSDRQPNLKGALTLVGLFDDEAIAGDPTDPSLPPFRLQRVRFDRIAPLFSDPTQHLANLYGFGEPSFDGLDLFKRLKQMVDRPDAETLLIEVPGQPLVLEAFLFRMAVTPGALPGLSLRLRIPAQKSLEVAAPIGGPWSVTVSSTSRFEGGIEFLLHPQNGLRIEPPTAAASVDAAFGLRAENGDGSPMILIGQVGGSRLELKRFSSRLPLRLSATSGAPSPTVDLGAELEVKEGKIFINASQADGFLAQILSGVEVESVFDLGAVYDTKDGLRFTGSATIEIALPTHLELGPLLVSSAYLIGGFDGGAIPLEFSADLAVQLGPLAASVNRLGAKARMTFPSEGGNAGIAQIDIEFKPPNGVGLAVDAGVVKGGGYLYFDFDREEYAGALELVFSGFLTLKAIGLITTRLPDGSKGFSLLIIITAEFGTGIQLGFGFVLLGVGGLLGLNRTMKLDVLTEGVRTGAAGNVLFPQNVVANAPRIISDLRRFFPPENGIFLIGPMAKLGWGTPALITLSLGIIIEIPGNIAILGVLRVVLPDEKAPLLVLQVAFIGAIEFDKQRAYFFASIFESRVLFITIEGEMGVLVAWGDDANFVVSVGGFHPQFTPPPLPFPTPKRVSLNILNESWGRIRVMGYFAVTSNTVQLGARAELFFGFSAFKIEGHLAFDALFQFDPFFFIIEISCGVSLKVFGIGLFSISLQFSLEGPTPWRAKGYGKLKILFFTIKANFDFTWGEKQDTSLPPIKVLPLLAGELEKLSNWKAQLPASNSLLVSLRMLEPGGESLVLHPLGTLTISQRAVPLNLRLDKVGNQKPSDGKRFSLNVASGLRKVADLEEKFAIAQFQDFKDADKLSQAAFQPEDGGLELAVSDQSLATGMAVKRHIRYESHIIDRNFQFLFIALFGFIGRLFNHFLNGSAVTKLVVSQHYKQQFQPFNEKIALKPEQFVVASTVDNRMISQQAVFNSEAKAHEFMQAEVDRDASRRALLHVIAADEVNI
jgi:hypothetical protein